jgi:hypothetical protein
MLPLLVASLPPARDLWWPAAVRGPAQEAAHLGALRAVLHAFAHHDWDWYRHLSLALAEHALLDVAAVHCPAPVCVSCLRPTSCRCNSPE